MLQTEKTTSPAEVIMEEGELTEVTTLDRSEQSRVHFSEDDIVRFHSAIN